jgi:site-specific recombinase XerD
MTTHNPNNERIKRQYFAYLKEAKRHSEPTVDAVAKALARFEADTKYRDFKSFQFEQAIAFKRRLTEQKNQQTGEKLSKATLHSTLAAVKAFFHWLAGQPATSRGFSIQTPTISTCRKRTCGWQRPGGNRWARPWSRPGTSSP